MPQILLLTDGAKNSEDEGGEVDLMKMRLIWNPDHNPFSKLDENVALNSGRPHRFGLV